MFIKVNRDPEKDLINIHYIAMVEKIHRFNYRTRIHMAGIQNYKYLDVIDTREEIKLKINNAISEESLYRSFL
jgi:hypothetical protein